MINNIISFEIGLALGISIGIIEMSLLTLFYLKKHGDDVKNGN